MENAIPEKQSPFATEPVGRLILRFAVPSVIALLVNSLYNIVDQIFIGWGVGYLGNGATNVVFPITIIALALAMMIGNGGAAYLSLKLGERQISAAEKGVGNAVTLVTVVSILLALIFLIWIDPILSLFGATDVLRPYALEYGYIKRRAAYHRFYTDMKWGHAQNYNITLNSGSLGIDKYVQIIKSLY